MLRDGYLDLLGEDEDPTGARPGQRLMASRVLPVIYERLWRPLGGRLLMGALGPDTAGERRIALEMLQISPGDAVSANSSPMRAAEDATSTDTGAADAHGADSLLPVDTLAGLLTNSRSKKPGRPSAVSAETIQPARKLAGA